jgi:alpha-1,3-mannosyltransferase
MYKSVALAMVQMGLSLLIIHKVNYTEIDFSTYMQQVQVFLAGERNYRAIKGDTGPIVYPAGFLYFYSFIYYCTDGEIHLAQYGFGLLQALTVFLVSRIYQKTQTWWPLVFTLLSKRIHSIYVLRLFNDPVAMVWMYLCVYLLIQRRWYLGSICYSIALSIKMNILLFAPGMAFLYYSALGFQSIFAAALVILVQILLAYPFWTHWQEYLSKAFELDRVFLYKWTVNWKMLTEEQFLAPLFSSSLLVIHLALLILALRKWSGGQIGNWVTRRYRPVLNAKGFIC